MLTLYRRIRRQLQLIRYYSATRIRTRWASTVEWGLLFSLLLALPAMLICDHFVQRETAVREVRGMIGGTEGGPFEIGLHDPDDSPRYTMSEPYGDLALRIVHSAYGWPLTTRAVTSPPRLDLNVYVKAGIDANARLPADSPLRQAITRQLNRSRRTDLERAWREQTDVESDRHWIPSIMGTFIWWVMLCGVTVVLASVFQFLLLLHRARMASVMAGRRARNRCAICNYNLHGLEFHARCPECGSLVE